MLAGKKTVHTNSHQVAKLESRFSLVMTHHTQSPFHQRHVHMKEHGEMRTSAAQRPTKSQSTLRLIPPSSGNVESRAYTIGNTYSILSSGPIHTITSDQ